MIVPSLPWLLAGLLIVPAAAPDSALRKAAADSAWSAPTPRPPATRVTAALHSAFDTVLVLPEVRVVRERLRREALRQRPTAFVTTLETGKRARALETMEELLQDAAGIHVLQYGGLGAFSTVSLRGAPAGQVAVLLDGLPLGSPSHSAVNLAELPATAIEKVEIYPGGSPLALGTGAPAGAVNFVTLSAPELRELRIVRGSFDTWEGRGSFAGRYRSLGGLLHLGYQGSNGDFRFHDDNGTPFNALDDSLSTRVNNRFDAVTMLAATTWRPLEGLRVGLREDVVRNAHGVPGLGTSPALHARHGLLRSVSQLDAAWDGQGLWPEARLRGGFQNERSRFRDPEGEIGPGPHDTDDRIEARSVDVGVAWRRLPLGFGLDAAGSLRRDDARLADRADGAADPPPSRRGTRGAMLGVQVAPLGEWVLLTAARRWDRHEDRLRWNATGGGSRTSDVTRDVDTPQLGARVRAPLGVELRANWTRGERPPDFLELFGNQGSVLGNPALVPEHTESWDAGTSWSLPARWIVGGAVTWAHYVSHHDQMILYVRNSPSTVKALNLSRARIEGDEVSLQLGGPFGLRASGAFHWQRAIDTGPVTFWNGKRLPQRPAREAQAGLEWRSGAFGAAVRLHHIGDNYLDRYNRQRVARRDLVGASFDWRPIARWPRLIVEGKNLGDDRTADVAGFPLPGRSVFVACEARLGGSERATHSP